MVMPQPIDPPDHHRDALLRDPELRRAIERVLVRRCPEADVSDVLQETLLAVHLSASLPDDPVGRRKYILGIARHKAATNARREERTVEVVPLEEAQQVPSPAVDDAVNDRDLLDKVVAELPESQLVTLQWLARYLLGESLADLAREATLDYETLYKRVTRLHRRLGDSGRRLGGALLVLLALGVAWYVWGPKPQVALPPPPTMPSVAPRPSTSQKPPSPPVPLAAGTRLP